MLNKFRGKRDLTGQLNPLIYKWRNWNPEKIHLLKVILIVGDRAGAYISNFKFSPFSTTPSCLPPWTSRHFNDRSPDIACYYTPNNNDSLYSQSSLWFTKQFTIIIPFDITLSSPLSCKVLQLFLQLANDQCDCLQNIHVSINTNSIFQSLILLLANSMP